ncbi:TonB-dependent receptor plug domain-containing protein [Brevundimonas subvibrioides]|uniref:TonB-dependent receptor n=1 Tax=Brevundimonas subvibrioides (strain ATCC 15264 / DSM 4735 / LMG 14903 / NBRC 16000 / CB 81) TaxID=633149 RepID=D9QHB2_BRESC|nr:TonB-dependent receptor [Brevundimonas subvibrioides ATCC 15264]
MNASAYRRRLLNSSMAFGASVAAASLVFATPTLAQDVGTAGQPDPATQSDEAAQVDDVVVTGSRISRQDYQATSPIVTVTQEDFQATGSVTIDTLVNDLPQFVPSVNSSSNNPSNGGQANINLRGLGTQRTLVLMNGRRVVPSNSDGTVDINLLPTPLIQNIEVISGGASAAYGSDALAGVANFILNENFEGVQFDAQYGVTDRQDGVSESYALTLGGEIADGRGHLVLSLGHSSRDQIFNRDREFSAISGPSGTTPLGSTTFDSTNLPSQTLVQSYFGDGALTNTGQFGFNNDGSVFSYVRTLNFDSPGGIDYDGYANPGVGDYVYNTGPLNLNQLGLNRWNAYVGGRYEINAGAEVYANLLFTEYDSANELAASPAAGNVPATGFRVPVTNPFISADLAALLASRPTPGGSFLLNKRFNALGGRRANENYNVYQSTVGVRGDLVGLRDWTYDVYAQYGRVLRTSVQSGNVSRSAVQRLLDAADGGASLCAGGFDWYGETALSAECATYIGRTAQNVTEQEQSVVEATLQGSLLELPAGDLRFAGGIQYREDVFAFRPDASLAQVNPVVVRPDGGSVGGSEIAGFNPGQPLVGDTNSVEYFLEVLVPLLSDLPFIQQLDLNLGYRLSDYSTVGYVDAYKADLDWEITDFLRVRGGVQRAVRAPSVGELFAPVNTSFPSVGTVSATGISGDPCDIRSSYRTGPNAAQVRDLCLAQGISASAIDAYVFTNNQVPGITGGNPDLVEETSDSFSAGLVITSPYDNAWLSGFSASIDYYDIEIENVIGTIGASAQLQGCFNARGENPTFDPNNGYCALFDRDPLSGNVNQAREVNGNLATLKTSGIDAQFDWNFVLADIGAPDWGNLNFNVVVGWLENRERQDAPGGPFTNRTGTIDSVFGNTFPEWKSLASVNWSHGAFGLGARWRHVGEMTQFGTTNELDAANYFDINGSWDLTERVSLRFTVNNVGDEQPIVYSPGVQANTDPSTYDTLGRRYSVGLTARF